ncbi:hypothetical protein ZWY2020_006767 [Hordeum vulgare]|nr:hypothetical protein ZWY2020_006767 [Hordeum vulgare]
MYAAPPMEVLHKCKVRRDHILARKKMEPPPRKPWIGPIPKVIRNPISLSDFIKPDCWIKGHKHSAGTRATGGEMDADGRKDCEAPGAAAQRSATSFGVSMQEGLQHAKASVVGTVQKAMAGREEDAAQVEATDEAEAKKKHLAG